MTILGFSALQGVAGEHPGRELDPSQRAVVELGDAASAIVLGAPGAGKTTVLEEIISDRVTGRGWSPNSILALTTSRATATALRDRIALRLDAATNGPLARSVNSLAFEIVATAARQSGVEPPVLLTGGEQDNDLSELIAGQIEDGAGPVWPAHLGPNVRRLRSFRTELRELMMRATEYELTPARLRELGHQSGRDEWVASADFIEGYLRVVASSRPGQLDPAELTRFAVAALESGRASETVDRLRLVLIDDVQEATRSTVSLLRALARTGVAVIAFGDPDVATSVFRGGEPDALGRLGDQLGLEELQTLHLNVAHRHGPVLRELVSTVTGRIGTAGVVGQRSAVAGGSESSGNILRVEADTPSHEWATIARIFRERHLVDGIAWNDMAVIVRTSSLIPTIARALALAEVPTRSSVGGRPLRDHSAARSLLSVIDAGTGRTTLTSERARELLLGPFGGLDKLTLRRLLLALRTEELAGGGSRLADALLVDALASPGRFTTIDHRVARAAEHLAETLAVVRQLSDGAATIEEILWVVWERSRLAAAWFDQAMGTGIAAAEANAHLDGINALFTAAKRYVEREPLGGTRVFLERVLDAEVPEDTLSPQSAGQSVLVTTPSSAVGLEFDIVAVAGLQDGVWPNLRIRGSLLYPQELVRDVTGLDGARIDERRAVLDDELRMFALAVSRARREVILASIANDDEASSVFFGLVPPATVRVDVSSRPPFSFRGLTGRLRRELTMTGRSDRDRSEAASALSRLASAGMPGADPDDWHGLLDSSTSAPIYSGEEQVHVSPSKLESVEASPLDWFVESIAGSRANTAMSLGTIVHWAMETAADSSIDAVWAAIESRWNELFFESPWLSERHRRAARVLAAGVAEYLSDFDRDQKTLISAEKRFQVEIDRAVLRGSIDRVERSGNGEVVIVDLKTGAALTRQQDIDAHPQLGAYQLAYATGVLDPFLDSLGEHRGAGAKLVYVRKGVRGKLYREGVQPALDEMSLEGFRTRIRQAAMVMAAASFSGPRELDEWVTVNAAQRRLHRVRAVSSD